MLSRIFGPKRDEVTGEWRRLHREKLYDLYCSTYFVWAIKPRIMRGSGHVARVGDRRDAHRVLVGVCEGKRTLVRPTRRWKDNIKMDFQEVG